MPSMLQSFRAQVAIMSGLLAIVVAITLSGALGAMFSDKIKDDELSDLHMVAKNAAHSLADGLASRTKEIQVLAASPTLWSEGLGADRVVQTLARTQALTPYSAWIGAVAPNGVVQAATGRLLLGVDVSERPWFKAGQSGTHVGDVHAAKLLAALLPRNVDGEPQRFVDFAAPIVSRGQYVGVLGMHGSWDWTRSVVEALLPDDSGDRRLEVFVLDRQGSVIYASTAGGDRAPAGTHLLAQSAGNTPKAATGDFLTAVVKVQSSDSTIDLGWSVVAREPVSIAYLAAKDGVVKALAFGGVAAVLACVIGWVLAGRLTRPLRRIAAAASRVERGELDVELPVLTGGSEAAQLSAALGGMMQRLVRANVELEQRVAERTAELESANAELDRQARTDPLTGLLNRRGMEERFRPALLSARRRQAALSILLVDIDHFKLVNDTHGHDAGDQALCALAQVMTLRLRESDTVARHGGEEFVVILPDTDARQARVVADGLVASVSQVSLATVGTITISCGVAQVRAASDTIDSVLQRADEALYRAKHEGRNRTSFADTGLELAPELIALE